MPNAAKPAADHPANGLAIFSIDSMPAKPAKPNAAVIDILASPSLVKDGFSIAAFIIHASKAATKTTIGAPNVPITGKLAKLVAIVPNPPATSPNTTFSIFIFYISPLVFDTISIRHALGYDFTSRNMIYFSHTNSPINFESNNKTIELRATAITNALLKLNK